MSGSIATAGRMAAPALPAIDSSTASTATCSGSPGTAPVDATGAAAHSTPTPKTRPHPCHPARCAGTSEHDPAAWADTLERTATVFVGAGWTGEAWDLMAAAGSLRMKEVER
jgi:hypothetical protein